MIYFISSFSRRQSLTLIILTFIIRKLSTSIQRIHTSLSKTTLRKSLILLILFLLLLLLTCIHITCLCLLYQLFLLLFQLFLFKLTCLLLLHKPSTPPKRIICQLSIITIHKCINMIIHHSRYS
jgi:hypothetical protein